MEKRWCLLPVIGMLGMLNACSPVVTLEAQTLPYNLVVTWDASPDGVTYNCYLDGMKVVTGVTGLTCTMPVNATGNHVVGVTAVNEAFVPNESVQATLAFRLQVPSSVTNVRVR